MRGTSNKKTPWWHIKKATRPKRKPLLPKITQAVRKAVGAVDDVKGAAETVVAEVKETVATVEAVVEQVEETIEAVEAVVDLTKLKVAELRKMAKALSVTGYSSMAKADLITALSP
jgi:phage shock protein A